MAGFVIDILFMYLIKGSIRIFHLFRSARWERSQATFTHWTVVEPGWGCTSVKLHYKFLAKGRAAKGSDEIPFYMRWHARTYAESLSRDLHPIIRVNPNNPRRTQFFEQDQLS
jgi:hypothetical protein